MKHATFMVRLSALLCFFALTVGAGQEKKGEPKTPLKKATNHKEINWMPYDVGLHKAKTESKHVFIDFTAKWCGWCDKMDSEVFSQPEVIEMVNTNFIPVKVNGDSNQELNIDGYKITEKNLARHEFRIRGYPAYWFLKPDGTKLGVIRGYRPTDDMMKAMTFVKDYKYDSTRTESTQNKEKSKN